VHVAGAASAASSVAGPAAIQGKFEDGHRYAPATGVVVNAYEVTSNAWTAIAGPFVATGAKVASASLKTNPAPGTNLYPVKPAGSDKTFYVREADADNYANWDVPERPKTGASGVQEPGTAKKLANVEGYLTPWQQQVDPKTGNLADSYRMSGFGQSAYGSDTSQPNPTLTAARADWKTEVEWSPVTPGFVQGEGRKMVARKLGPDHPMGRDPSDDTRVNSAALTLESAKVGKPGNNKWIAGHMLNDNLGGPGDQRANIVAIPDYLNGIHKNSIEKEVKETVNDHGKWVHYEFEVTAWHQTGKNNKEGSAQQYAKSIQTTWWELDSAGGKGSAEHHRDFTIPECKDLSTEVAHATENDDRSRWIASSEANAPGTQESMFSMISTGSPFGTPLVKRGAYNETPDYPGAAAQGSPIDEVLTAKNALTTKSASTVLDLQSQKISVGAYVDNRRQTGYPLTSHGKNTLTALDREKTEVLLEKKMGEPSSEMGGLLRGKAQYESVQRNENVTRTSKKQRALGPTEEQQQHMKEDADYEQVLICSRFANCRDMIAAWKSLQFLVSLCSDRTTAIDTLVNVAPAEQPAEAWLAQVARDFSASKADDFETWFAKTYGM
jgi:hypothetical protein